MNQIPTYIPETEEEINSLPQNQVGTTAPQNQVGTTAMINKGNHLLCIEPMTFGDVFNKLINLYTQHGMVLVKSMAIIYSPFFIATAITIPIAIFSPASAGPASLIMALAAFPFSLAAAIAGPAIMGKHVSNYVLGKDVELWETLSYVWENISTIVTATIGGWVTNMGVIFAGVLGTGLISGGIILAAGLLATILPEALAAFITAIAVFCAVITGFAGMFLMSATMYAVIFLTPVVAVLEEKSWFDAPSRALSLVFQTPWIGFKFMAKLMTIIIILGMLSLFVTIPLIGIGAIVAQVTGMAALAHIVQQLATIISTVVIGPALFSVCGLLYYDQRVKHEQFTGEDAQKLLLR